MNNIRQQYNRFTELFNARHMRERILITGLITALLINTWLMLLHDPLSLKKDKLNAQIQSLTKQIETTDNQLKILVAAKQVDPDRKIKQRITLAQQHIDKLDEKLQLTMKGLIKPTQMAIILEQVLTQQTNMRFERIQSLAAIPLIFSATDKPEPDEQPQASTATNQAANDKPDIGVFRHGIEMEFSGSYLETLAYLQQLQKLPWNFYWDDVLFDVVSYPKSRVIIRVHTLSLKEGWIGV